MNGRLYVLSCSVAAAFFAAAVAWAAGIESCVCTKSGSPTAQEVRAKAAAHNARDRAVAEKERAGEIKEQAATGSLDASSSAVDTAGLGTGRPMPSRYRVIVSFDPAGDAPSSSGAEELDRIVAAFEHRTGQSLERRSLSRHTGGLSVCMPLSGLDAKQQQELVSELRASLVPLGPVYVDEYARCGRELRPTGQVQR